MHFSENERFETMEFGQVVVEEKFKKSSLKITVLTIEMFVHFFGFGCQKNQSDSSLSTEKLFM